MKGFYNRLLRIDVTRHSFEIQSLSDAILETTLGGKGLAAHLLLELNPQGVDPLSPDNHLLITTGPAAGSPVWGSCRHGIFSKSPQTGFFAESYSGGTVAEYIAKTGYDAIVICGRSPKPVWLEINSSGVTFHPADDLWGKDTYQTEDRIKDLIRIDHPDDAKCGVICIGPAGENLVAYAVVENDYWRSAGRTGTGAVMGSKKIKAISFQGRQSKTLFDPEGVKAFSGQFAKQLRDNPGVNAYKTLGTPMMVDIMSAVESFPTHYWHQGRAAHQEHINAEALHTRCEVTPHACRKCFIACGRLSKVKEGRHSGLKLEGPEYETIYTFGGLCEVKGIEDIIYLNDICDRLGMDTISAGNLVALTIEAVRQKRVDYNITYGEVDSIAALLEDIAYRRQLGELLAQGIKKTAAQWGMADQAIHVKGLEPAGYDPRVLKGMGLSYGTSPRGACHLRTTFYKPELSHMIDPEQIEGKAEMLVEWEDRLIVFDALILCRFYRDCYQWDELKTTLRQLTGLSLDTNELRRIAAGISDNTRRFNLREGLTPADDMLPKRFYKEALPITGSIISEEQMTYMLRDYYQQRGWDDQGRPRKK